MQSGSQIISAPALIGMYPLLAFRVQTPLGSHAGDDGVASWLAVPTVRSSSSVTEHVH